jgi:hypothetical protein
LEKVIKFSDYKFESEMYNMKEDGTMELAEWSYYEDHYPEKYDMNNKRNPRTWVIKNKHDKVALISGEYTNEKIEKIIELLK